MPSSLSPLRVPVLRRLLTAYTVNRTGDWFGEIALSLLLLQQGGGVLAVTALWTLSSICPALLGPPLIARLEQASLRRVLPGLFAAEAGIFALLATLAVAGAPTVVVLFLAVTDATLALTASALTRATIVCSARPQGLHREANALINIAFTVAMAAGPVLAGVACATLGVSIALTIDAASFALAALAVGPGCRLVQPDVEPSSAAGRIRAGLEHLRSQTLLRRLIVAEAVSCVFFALVIPVELVFVTQTLGGSERDFGLVLAAWGAGAVAGSALLTLLSRAPVAWLLLGSYLTMIAGYLGMGAAGAVTEVIAFSALGGIGNGIQGMALITAIQERTPDGLQAQVNGALGVLNTAGPGIGFVLGGLIAAAASPRAAYWVAGMGALVAVVVAAGGLRSAGAAMAAPSPGLSDRPQPAPSPA